jgi:GNAT superfamily N-acetyltransferase
MNNGIEISSDPARLDPAAIHHFLATESHWAQGIPLELVERSIRGSLCFGAYAGTAQIAFARVVTDGATFAYLCDVFVLPEYRGRGVARRLLDAVFADPRLQGLRRFALATRDASGLYANFGFTPLARPSIWMERHNPHVYATEYTA